jgi:hypothetical protein
MAFMLDFATCRCGFSTPIRPSRPVLEAINQGSTEIDERPLLVACARCKRVFSVPSHQLERHSSIDGLSPYHAGAPLVVFRVHLDCDEEGCETPLDILAVRSSDTGKDALEIETDSWHGKNLKCPSGHENEIFPLG